MSIKERKTIAGALRAAKKLNNQEQINLLNDVFEFDEAGNCLGYNEKKVDYYIWLSAEPEVK